MPQNTRDIKRRIKSVKNTAQITKAMEMVAVAKLRRVQSAVQQAKPYVAKLEEMLAELAPSARFVKHPLLESRPVKKTGYLVITTDRGLAGPYNSQLLRKLHAELRHVDHSKFVVYVIGRKGRDFLKRNNYPIANEITGIEDTPRHATIAPLAADIINAYANQEFDELYFVYNEFVNMMVQRPVIKKVLPLAKQEPGQETTRRPNYLFEPDEEAVMKVLLPKYAESLLFQAVLDAKAGEQAARMNAMGKANDAAIEMIGDLTLALNRARQAAITTQIVEVVSGAQALQ